MTTVVIYGGGFQPFHQGHLSSYLQAKKAFPNADFYVAASANVKERPIPYQEKKFLATQAGVLPEDFPDIVVKSPLNPREILEKYNPEQDVFILVRSERDPVPYTKKDGSPAYFQPYTGKDVQPFSKHGYVFVTKKHDFNVNDQVVYSGTQVRDMYTNADDKGRAVIIKQLYPKSKQQKQIKQILDKYLSNTMTMEDIKALYERIKPLINEATDEQKAKLAELLETAKESLSEVKIKPETVEHNGYTFELMEYFEPVGQHLRVIVSKDRYTYIGHAVFLVITKKHLEAESVGIEQEYRGQGLATFIYDWLKSLGYTIHKSQVQTKSGAALWNKRRGEERVWEANNPAQQAAIAIAKKKKKGVKEGVVVSLTDDPRTLRKLAAIWWNGNEDQHFRAAAALKKMGWDIQEDEDDILLRTIKGDKHISIPMDDLENITEGDVIYPNFPNKQKDEKAKRDAEVAKRKADYDAMVQQELEQERKLRRYAAMWYHNDQSPQIERILDRLGFEIGEMENEDGGVFIMHKNDINGNSFVSWTAADLEGESITEVSFRKRERPVNRDQQDWVKQQPMARQDDWVSKQEDEEKKLLSDVAAQWYNTTDPAKRASVERIAKRLGTHGYDLHTAGWNGGVYATDLRDPNGEVYMEWTPEELEQILSQQKFIEESHDYLPE